MFGETKDTMETAPETRKVLKDVSNLTNRKLVSAFPVNMEDRENADPRKLLNKKIEDEVIPEVKKVDIGRADSDTSSDGFEVDDDLQLDEANEDDEDLDTTRPLENNENLEEEEAPSPFIVSSLLNNKLITDVVENDDNGASPLFSQQTMVRQERKKLDFDNMDLLVSPSLNSQRPTPLRRCFSMVETKNLQLKTVNSSPEMTKFCDEDMTSPLSRPFASFKRPNAPLQPLNNLDIVQQPCKKIRRGFSLKENRNEMRSESRNFDDHLNKSASTSMLDSPQIAKPMLQLSLSESENIKRACSLADVPNLTGDRSRKLSLPTVFGSGRSSKTLDNVDCHTMADLLRGKYDDKIASYRIVDARYCYEFKGGHIRGAENFGSWDEEAFFSEFLPENLGPRESIPNKEEKVRIIIFHCEFSSARGPTLMKLLRQRDRDLNVATFPALHYPECYLLSQGYKEFYKHYPELCEPRNYVPMNDPNFAQEERKFHKKSRSWAPGGTISRTASTSRLLKL